MSNENLEHKDSAIPEDALEVADPNVDYYMLTTIDNPFNPFTQWKAWYSWDIQHLNACSFLARVIVDSPTLSVSDQALATQEAINEILKYDVTGFYRKVLPSDYE